MRKLPHCGVTRELMKPLGSVYLGSGERVYPMVVLMVLMVVMAAAVGVVCHQHHRSR